MTLSFQTQVKGYRILDLIDTGGFGEVYRAHQTAIDRDVAIKIILPEHANKPEFIRRFEAEAQLVAKLEHPHIAPLYDYWRDPDGAYLVMRYLRGGNLRDRIRQNCLDLKTAAQVVDQIASALYVAHRNNVIHRDIKPENILLDEDGNAYLTDFGIAKDLAGPKDYLTQPDSVMGSLDYLAPEQARGQPVTPSTDIYSLGVVVWEALVGQHPFEELSSVERLYKFINDPLPLIESLDAESNARINPVIQKATQKNPEHRYKDVIEFAEAFREAAGLMVEKVDLDLSEVLTAREQDVLRCLVQRKSNKEISEELVIELSTVKWYVGQIFKKLNVRSRVQAAARAKELDLVYDRKPKKYAATTGIYGLPELENPYKGLNAFTAADERDFFGREKLVLRLMERMSENSEYARFLSIVGPSGSGKSSLVKAGLVPALWRGGLPGSEKWFIVEMVPGTDAIDELEVALTKIVPQQGLNIGEYLRRDEKGLLTASKLILPEDDSELVLVVDQFEELFTLIKDEAERNRFLDLLHHAVMNKRSRIRVVVTMRADFYDRPLHYPAIAEMIRNRVETILPLSAEELERAIVNPARRVGLQLEEGLLARIINDVLYQPGGLPLMQYALTELYESRHDRLLILSGYEAMGGVVGALANRAEQIYLEMDKATRLAAKQVFLRLVTLGDDGKNTRRRTALSELVEMFDDADMVEEIVDTYTAYRLLSMDHDPETRMPTVEVAHEAILVEWGRLREWLNESQMDIRIHRQLARATRDWQNAGMDDSYLLRGARLQQFEGWREETDLALTATEHQYLGKSITEREREQVEEAARQEHERALEARAQKILRGLVAVMALAAVIAIGLSVFAFGQRNEALQNFSMSLAAHVQNALDNKENDLALALALAASEFDNPPPIVARMLRQAAYAPGPIAQIDIEETFGMDQMPFSMAVSPTEFVSLIGFHDGTLILWDVMEAKEIRRFDGHTDIIADVAFSPDGKTALSGSYDTTAIVWDVETGEILTRFAGHHGWLRVVAFSPDGKTAATGSFVGTEATDIKNPGELILWDPATGEEITQLEGHPSAVEALAFSPDGSKLLASSGMFASISNEASLYYWDLESEEIIYQLPLSFDAYDIAITPDGLTAVSASTDAVNIWDLETGKLVSTLSGYTGYPRSTVFTPYGDQLVTIDSNGKVTLWDFKEATKSLDALFHDHESGSWSDSQLAMARLALSPDGHYALSTADDKTFIIWNLRDAGEIRRFSGHESLIGGIAITPDGNYILSGSGSMCFCGIPGKDNSVRFWDAATGEQIYLLEGHQDLVTMTHMTPDGKTGISSSLDGSIRVWDLVNGIEKRVIEDAHHGGVFSVAISPDGKLALSGSVTESINPDTDGTILWNLETGERLAHYDYGVDNSTSVMFNPDGKSGYAGMNEFTYLDFETGEFTPIIPETRACCVGLDISSDGKTCFSANNEDTILRSWDIETGQIIQEFGIHGGSRTRVELSADDQVLLSSGLYGDLNLWEPQTGELLRTWNSSGVVHLDIDMSDDGKIAISPGPNNSVITWNLDLPLEISNVRAWVEQNRVVRELSCEERLTYSIEPLCKTE